MKKIFIISIVFISSLCVKNFVGENQIDKTNENTTKQENEIIAEVKTENIIIDDMSNSISKIESKEEKKVNICQDNNNQQEAEVPTTKKKVKQETQKNEKTQTKTTQKEQDTAKSNSSKKTIEANLDSSTTFNIQDAGTASWGHLTDEDLQALGL